MATGSPQVLDGATCFGAVKATQEIRLDSEQPMLRGEYALGSGGITLTAPTVFTISFVILDDKSLTPDMFC